MKIRSGVYTVIMDVTSCSENTYANWCVMRFTREASGVYAVDKLSNAEGNGQRWDAIATMVNGVITLTTDETDLLLWHAIETLCRDKGATFQKRLPCVSFPNALVQRKCNGARYVAGPSILRKGCVRDKNVNRMRRHVETIDMAAAMAARRK